MMSELIDSAIQRHQCLDQICAAWASEYHQRGGSTYCIKGCSGCCSLVVNSTFTEALLAAESLDQQQIRHLREWIPKMKHTADNSKDLRQWLASYRQQVGPCPFLDHAGSCGIYPVRPISCRSLLSTKAAHWCTADFSSMTSHQKQSFMASLDRSAVAFPTHYAATPQDIGRELEEATLRQMETVYTFSLIGSLPWLVWLELEHSLSSRLSEGSEAVQSYLASKKLTNPFLIVVV